MAVVCSRQDRRPTGADRYVLSLGAGQQGTHGLETQEIVVAAEYCLQRGKAWTLPVGLLFDLFDCASLSAHFYFPSLFSADGFR